MTSIFNLQRLVLAIATFAVIALGSATASADTITFSTAPGATNAGLPVSATATFTVSAPGVLTITLTNNIVNPTSVAQNISDIFFQAGNLTNGTLTSSSGQNVTVAANGVRTLGATVSTGWALSNGAFGPSGASGFELTVLGTATGPAHTILGAPGPGGVYTNANGSIAGNDPHNPFLNQTATFSLSIAGLTSVNQLTNINFSFNTVAGQFVPGIPQVPEPTSMLLLGTGLVGVAGAARRRFRK